MKNVLPKKENKGITLVSLVVTIIVLLILAGVSISMLFGENGILKNAENAKIETQKGEYQEKINLAVTEANISKKQLSDLEILKEVKTTLEKDIKFKEAVITGPDEKEEKLKLTVVTKEGYVYYIYADRVEELKEESDDTEEPEIEIIEGEIIFSTLTWSEGKASITISTNTEYKLQYQINNIEEDGWVLGTEVTELLHGDIVYARLWDGKNAGDYALRDILDETVPNVPTLTVTSGTAGTNGWYRSNVVVKITAGADEQSGVDKTTYTLSGATTKAETTITSEGTITISTEGTTTVTAYTYDVAGNKSSANTLSVKIDKTSPSSVSLSFEDNINHSNGYYKVTASTSDALSKVKGYYFSTNGGTSWSALQTSSTYTVNFTANFSHNVKVRTIDNAGNYTDSGTVTMNPKQVLIRQLYEQILKRSPNNTELNYHTNVTNAAQNTYDIGACSWAVSEYGSNYTEYIKVLYKGIFGRSAGTSEIEAWLLNFNAYGIEFSVKQFTKDDYFATLCSKYGLSYSEI